MSSLEHGENGASNEDSVLTICALQPALRKDSQSPTDAIEAAVALMKQAKAKAAEIELFVLPEISPIGYTEHTFAHYLPSTPDKQKLYLDLDKRMAEAAQELGTYICYGTVGWHDKKGSSLSDPAFDFTIRQMVVNPTGQTVAVYDKIYICNVGDCSEARFFINSPIPQPVSFAIREFRIGLIICFDQRFPMLARTYAAHHNVDVLLQPAAFVRDCTFVTWKSFRETRAVENSIYYIGLNYGGATHGETTCVPPWVDDSGDPNYEPQSLGCETDAWLLCRIQRSVLSHVRTHFPYHRELKKEYAGAKW